MEKQRQHDYLVTVYFNAHVSNAEGSSKESLLEVVRGMLKDDPEEYAQELEIEYMEDLGESKEQY